MNRALRDLYAGPRITRCSFAARGPGNGCEAILVYILASAKNGTLYVGVTNDLARRIYEHREGLADGFTKQYGVTILVHSEGYDSILEARVREGRLKKWRRAWKIALIEENNPGWRDLFDELT